MKANIFFLGLFLSALTFQTSAQDLKEYAKTHYNVKKNLAIQGYDPVAYFTKNKALEGSSDITTTHKGVVYRFASQANKSLFKADPKKYEPEYGGYCAYAMADGDKVKVDPETFKIVDGRLFLFYNFNWTNTLKKWNGDEPKLLKSADKYWADIIIK